MFAVYLNGDFVERFTTRLEAKDYCFTEYAIWGNFSKESYEIKEE